tara:strand:+ start:380 stop:934 length:555 start_codon:yes stop_codon:yes gene_type:complete
MKYKVFDFTSLITETDRKKMCKDVKASVNEGKYYTNCPRYQTNFDVFTLPGIHWLKLRMSFYSACFFYLEKEAQISKVQSWSYMTSLEYPEDRKILWHNHDHKREQKLLSGIYYVYIPEDVEDFKKAGTEFAPNGVGKKKRTWIEPCIGKWVIYDSYYWHRPGVLQSYDNRFIVAADMEYVMPR